MKRLFVVMIAAIAAGLLAGCFFPDDVPDKEQGNSSAYGEKDVYGLNETAVFKTLKFTATDGEIIVAFKEHRKIQDYA